VPEVAAAGILPRAMNTRMWAEVALRNVAG
jgi:hypothetical protein